MRQFKITGTNQDIPGVTGVFAYWRLSGEVSVEALREAAERHGLDASILPKAPSPKRAIRRAVDALATGRSRRVEAHPRGGYAIVTVGETEERDLRFSEGLRAWYDRESGSPMVSDPEHPDAARVLAGFDHYRETYVAEDLSLWLPRLLLNRLDAVSIRPGGGFYFVPAGSVDVWRSWANVFREVTGHKLYSDIPAMKTEGVLEGVLDAVVDEIDTVIATQKKGLADAGKRAIQSKVDALTKAQSKVETYEGILSRALPELRARLSQTQATMAHALLVEDED